MNSKIFRISLLPILFTLSSCAVVPLSERALKEKIPIVQDAVGDQVALIVFSSDKKYETEKGVPLPGDPVVCSRNGAFRVNGEDQRKDQVRVKAGEKIAVASVIQWVNAGWEKTCWPFVAFTPESGSKYIVVNERIGGKGVSWLWTGVASQTCQVSVYKETPAGFEPVQTEESSIKTCRSK